MLLIIFSLNLPSECKQWPVFLIDFAQIPPLECEQLRKANSHSFFFFFSFYLQFNTYNMSDTGRDCSAPGNYSNTCAFPQDGSVTNFPEN